MLNDEAQIAYAQTQLGFTTIVSPIDGRVGIRQVDVGNFLRAAQGTTIVVVTQLRPISVIFTVSAEAVERSKLDLGIAHVPVIALAQDDTTELDRGSADVVDNMVDQTTGTIKLKANFPNANLKLWPGNFVNGRLIVDTRHDGVTVPVGSGAPRPALRLRLDRPPRSDRGDALRHGRPDLRRSDADREGSGERRAGRR